MYGSFTVEYDIILQYINVMFDLYRRLIAPIILFNCELISNKNVIAILKIRYFSTSLINFWYKYKFKIVKF